MRFCFRILNRGSLYSSAIAGKPGASALRKNFIAKLGFFVRLGAHGRAGPMDFARVY
jgi:hypothetical protein